VPNLAINSGGLGDVQVADSSLLETLFTTPTQSELISLCSGSMLAYLSDFSCWAYSPSIWAQAAVQMPSFTVAAPAAPSSALTAPYVVTPDEAQAASDAAIAQTQANAAAFVAATPFASVDQCELFTADWPWPISGLTCPQALLYGSLAALGLYLLVRR